MSKKIIVTGATGLIGTKLCKALINRGDQLTIFSRSTSMAAKAIPGAKEYIEWDYDKPETWAEFINGKDSIIHLAGVSIAGKRWNDDYKNKILKSRKLSTQNLVEAIHSAKKKPSSFISSSATGYYGNAGDKILNEESESGDDFLAQVCKEWENASEKIESLGVRRVNIRTGIVLSAEGGALKQMLLPFRLFIGGPLGNGRQWFPWVHIDDLIRIYIYALDNSSVSGKINAVSPNPVTMKEFALKLGKAMHRPSFFPVPVFALKLAIGKAAEPVVASQRTVPQRLLKGGFKFRYENVEAALKDLLH